jgi:hypothetical protein
VNVEDICGAASTFKEHWLILVLAATKIFSNNSNILGWITKEITYRQSLGKVRFGRNRGEIQI